MCRFRRCSIYYKNEHVFFRPAPCYQHQTFAPVCLSSNFVPSSLLRLVQFSYMLPMFLLRNIIALQLLLFSLTVVSPTSAISLSVFTNFLSCFSARFSQSSWQTNYFEPTLLPLNQQNNSISHVALAAATLGLQCGANIPNSTHTLKCVPNGLVLIPPRKTRFSIVFLQGATRPGSDGVYFQLLNQILRTNPDIAPYLRIEYPFAPFRKLSFSTFTTPPILIGRAWFDTFAPPQLSDLAQSALTAQFDRLGLYRTAQQVSLLVRRQLCTAFVPANRVLILGHSLGALATIETVVSTDLQLAGAIAVAGALPRPGDYLSSNSQQAFNPSKQSYDFTMIHGTQDEVVPFGFSNFSAQILSPILRSTGTGFNFEAVEGGDHSQLLFQSRIFYGLIRTALKKAFMK